MTLLTGACGGTNADVAMHEAETLRAERDEWRGPKDGLVLLRRGVHAIVDTAVDPSRATSRMIVHLAETRFGPPPEREIVTFAAPGNAVVDAVRARLVRPDGEAPVRPATVTRRDDDDGAVDPGQGVWELAFDAIPPGAILEVVVELDVPGILASDAQWLAARGASTHELLLRYDIPSDAVGSFGAVNETTRPIVTEKDGYKIIALLLHDVPPREGEHPAYARYVTTRATPRGYELPIARTWAEATAPYVAGLVAPTEGTHEGYAAPFTTALTGKEAATAVFTWVRDRLQREDALTARWDAARGLVGPLEKNDLTQTDKVHLLRWLLDAAHVESVFAMGRSARYPRLEPTLPTPDAFDTPLVYVPAFDLWLDPACRECAPGEVRPALRGGAAITLPAKAAPVILR
ncbi:MAG: hypothetical protein H6745_11685 [Deltaproteobacteria bacterium]|nr:hypothetical protein [Deltaproteobacteria bacterium]